MTSICDSMSLLHTQKKIPNLLQSAVWDDKGKAQTKAVWFSYSPLLQCIVYSLIWMLSKYSSERIECITFIKTFWGFVHLVNSAVDYCQNWSQVSSWVIGWSLGAQAGIAVIFQQRMARGTDKIKWSLGRSNFIILNILLQQVDFHYRHMLPCVLLMRGLTQKEMLWKLLLYWSSVFQKTVQAEEWLD